MFEFTDDIEWILGRPNFVCGQIARILREGGIEIPEKAEAEQARVIYWLLEMHQQHGEDWREKIVAKLDEMNAA